MFGDIRDLKLSTVMHRIFIYFGLLTCVFLSKSTAAQTKYLPSKFGLFWERQKDNDRTINRDAADSEKS